MGMVLCKHTGPEIEDFVNMVQGLHAEGVVSGSRSASRDTKTKISIANTFFSIIKGFHLPCQTRLPIVFLPAKFNSEDPLQRLGIAFMGKASTIPALMPPANGASGSVSRGRPVTAGRLSSGDKDKDKGEPKKKKQRRQSAPAGIAPLANATATGAAGGGGSGSGGRGQKRKESMMAVGRIEEEP